MNIRYTQALHCENPEVIPHQMWLKHLEFITDCPITVKQLFNMLN